MDDDHIALTWAVNGSRRQTWIPDLGIMQMAGREWTSESGLPLPVGGDEWLAVVRNLRDEAQLLLTHFGDGRHKIETDEEHDLVIRQCAAQKVFRSWWPEIVRGLMLALDARDSGSDRNGEDREDGLSAKHRRAAAKPHRPKGASQ